MASNFLVRHEQHAHWSMGNVMFAQQSKRVHGNGDACLHVEYARPPDSAIVHAEGHVFECSQFPHGIGVTEQQYGLDLRYAGKVGLHMIAEFADPMNLRGGAEMFEPGGKKIREVFHS